MCDFKVRDICTPAAKVLIALNGQATKILYQHISFQRPHGKKLMFSEYLKLLIFWVMLKKHLYFDFGLKNSSFQLPY